MKIGKEPKPVFCSVIIPTYNRSRKIEKALDSLANQTFSNFEVIIVDDGSTDDTHEIVRKYQDKLQIEYLWTPNWGGPARPRNIGVSKSKGEWICFFDSDDWWYPKKLEECFKYASNYDVIFHPLDIIKPNNKGYYNRKMGSSPRCNQLLKDLIIYGNCIPNSGAMLHINVLKKLVSLPKLGV